MQLDEMFAKLAPKPKLEIEISGFKFYVRPMTVSEYFEHASISDKDYAHALMVSKCVTDDEGIQVFETPERVQSLYPAVQIDLFNAVAGQTVFTEPRELEKELK